MHRDYASVMNMTWKVTLEGWVKGVWWDLRRKMDWGEYEGKSNTTIPYTIVQYLHAMLKTFTASEQSPAVLARGKPMNPAGGADEGRARKPPQDGEEVSRACLLHIFYFVVVAYWAKMSVSPNLEDEIRKLIEQSNPVDVLEIGSGRCIKESAVMARARGDEDVYLVLRSNIVTCIDLINAYIASRSANPPTITEIITYARSIGITGVQQVYAYLKKLCTAGLVQFRYKCGAKGRCDVIQGCPITAVEPTELGITYALATAQLTKANQLAPLRQEAEKRGITPQASPMIRLAILKTPKATAHIIKLINTKQ